VLHAFVKFKRKSKASRPHQPILFFGPVSLRAKELVTLYHSFNTRGRESEINNCYKTFAGENSCEGSLRARLNSRWRYDHTGRL
jgi:hypothetical protein